MVYFLLINVLNDYVSITNPLSAMPEMLFYGERFLTLLNKSSAIIN